MVCGSVIKQIHRMIDAMPFSVVIAHRPMLARLTQGEKQASLR